MRILLVFFACFFFLSFSGCLGDNVYYIDENVNNYDVNMTGGLNWDGLSGAIPWADENVADDITLTDITQITNRDYSDLQGLPDFVEVGESIFNWDLTADFNTLYLETGGGADTNVWTAGWLNDWNAVTVDGNFLQNLYVARDVVVKRDANIEGKLQASGTVTASNIDQNVQTGASPTLSNANMTGNVSVWDNDSGYITGYSDTNCAKGNCSLIVYDGNSIWRLGIDDDFNALFKNSELDLSDYTLQTDGNAWYWKQEDLNTHLNLYTLQTDGNTWYLQDITGESIGSLSDVDLTGIAEGKVLKADAGGNWIIGDDDDTTYVSSDFDHDDLSAISGGGAGEYNHITDAELTTLQATSGVNTGDQIVPDNEPGSANHFLTAYNSATGAWTKAQPTWANINADGDLEIIPTGKTNIGEIQGTGNQGKVLDVTGPKVTFSSWGNMFTENDYDVAAFGRRETSNQAAAIKLLTMNSVDSTVGARIGLVNADVSGYSYATLNFMVGTTTGTDVMSLLSNGNVGIGTRTPGEALEVEGNIQATGYKSSDGSSGWTGTFTNGDGDTVTVKNGLITNVT